MSFTDEQFTSGNPYVLQAIEDAGLVDTRACADVGAALAVALEVARLREAVLLAVDELRARR